MEGTLLLSEYEGEARGTLGLPPEASDVYKVSSAGLKLYYNLSNTFLWCNYIKNHYKVVKILSFDYILHVGNFIVAQKQMAFIFTLPTYINKTHGYVVRKEIQSKLTDNSFQQE